MRLLALSFLVLLCSAPAAWASPLSIKPDGSLSPLTVDCPAPATGSCSASLWGDSRLLELKLGRAARSPEVRLASGSGSGRFELALNKTGVELLRNQPDGMVARLKLVVLDSQGHKIDSRLARLRLRFPRRLRVPADQLFNAASSTPSLQGIEQLGRLQSSLPEPGEMRRAICTGHSAASSDAKQSLFLARSRALEVCSSLGAEAFRVESEGDSLPLASNRTAEGRALNRRVEVRFEFLPAPALSRPLLGIHSMLKPGMSEDEVEATMAHARAAGISMLRFDAALNYVGQYEHVVPGMHDFEFFDMVRRHARDYNIKLLAVATWSPQAITDCPDADGYRCPPRNVSDWTRLLEQAALRAPEIKHWQIWNEPNSRYFKGSPEQYAALLRASSETLHSVDQGNQVVLGGPAGLDRSWLHRLLPQVQGFYDIAALHLRPSYRRVGVNAQEARQIFELHGFEGQLWITEFGYPSDSSHQFDAGFSNGPESQADYYRLSLAKLRESGVSRVFLTGRDAPEYGPDSPFSSEGLWSFSSGSIQGKAAYTLLAANS